MERSLAARRMVAVAAAVASAVICVPAARAALTDILAFALGMSGVELEEELRAAGVTVRRRGARDLVVEHPVLAEVYESQRLLYDLDMDGELREIHMVVEPDPGADGSDVLRLYETVTTSLARRLGPPTWERSDGRPGRRDILAALAAGAVVRTMQWEGERTIRAGIPARADGRLVIAILITESPLPRDQRLWGREDF